MKNPTDMEDLIETAKKVKCQICDKEYHHRATLTSHFKKVHAEIQMSKRIKCDLCDKTCYSQTHLKTHQKAIHFIDSQVLKCHLCNSTFKYEKNFKEHIESHEKENRSKCEYCGKMVWRIETHIKYVHKGLKRKVDYGCDKCDKKFSNKQTLTRHEERIHLKIKNKFKCNHCEKYLANKRSLQMHLISFHFKENGFKCDKCDKVLPEKSALDRHMTLLHQPYPEKLMIKCDICNLAVKKNSLWSHMENHSEKRRSIQNVENSELLQDEVVRTDVKIPNQCEICHKVVDHLRMHVKTHHRRCKKCSITFPTVDELNQHKDNCKSSLECKFCMKKFTYHPGLKQHIKKFHEGTKLKMFKCDDCNKNFNVHGNLKRHYLTVHQKIKSHKCDTCGKCFGTKDEAKRHNISVHEDLRNFVCKMCDKKFSMKDSLVRHHKRVHENLGKKFTCSQCEKCFYNQNNLNHHRFNVHSTDEVKCDFCTKVFKSVLYLKNHMKSQGLPGSQKS